MAEDPRISPATSSGRPVEGYYSNPPTDGSPSPIPTVYYPPPIQESGYVPIKFNNAVTGVAGWVQQIVPPQIQQGIVDDFGGDLSSRGSRTPGSSDQQLQPRHEMWDNLSGALSSTDYPPPTCPQGAHAYGSCLCQPSSLAEESGPRIGISRIVMLAEEVLDQIHQQPMSLSLSVVSLPAPESVVDSFPVKTHGKSEKLESADDVSQCYICLAEYEEGDRIRILPCHHEYHVSCVDKWLKEVHGVCPLCRGDVSLGSTDS